MVDLVVCFWSWIGLGGGWLFVVVLLLRFAVAVVVWMLLRFGLRVGWLLWLVFRCVFCCWLGVLTGVWLFACLILLD